MTDVRFRPETVLIIDDDAVIVEVAAAILRNAGYAVESAFDAMQGFRLANQRQPALILLDIHMPAGGGLHVLDRLARSSRTRHIPVIVVTGSDQDGIEAYVRQLGAVAFVAKPIDHDALLAAVSEASAELLTVIHGAASKP